MASEIKVDTISEKTSAGGVTIDGLLIKDGNISGDVALAGTTPTFTIGDAGAEDAALVFDGNAQDFHIGLDDSADDLVIGVGSTLGTTTAIAIDENANTTFSGTVTVGVDDTGKDVKLFGATAGSFLLWDESADALLLTDSTPIQIGDAQDLTLYHDGTNSYITNKTGALKVATETSGIAITLGHTTSEVTVADNFTVTGTITLADGSLALADLDIDGGTDIGADLVDADLFIVDDGAGGTNRKTAASRLKTYIGGGIANAQTWRLTTNFTGDADPISSNLEADDTYGNVSLGSAMTESSGVFTFPQTGMWLILVTGQWYYSGDTRIAECNTQVTTDNSSYNNAAQCSNGIVQAQSAATYSNAGSHVLLDVSNTTNVKVKFQINVEDNSASTTGSSTYNRTHFTFIRLADT